MKLPKALLGAILVGITVQTTTSCKGELPEPVDPDAKAAKKEVKTIPDNCPACGMG